MSRNRGKHRKHEYESEKPSQNPNSEPDVKFHLEPKTANQKNYLHTIRKNVITICTGPAGTGKTALAVGYGIQNIKCSTPLYKKLIIVRPIIGACGEDIGFLKGDLEEKLAPWMGPIIDNLKVFLSEGTIDYLIKNKQIEGLALSHMRGRSLNDCYILLDEAQNCSPEQLLMMLTRIGKNSKLVINGDLKQSDLKDHEKSGLMDAITRLEDMEGIGICKLDHNDILRNPLIGEILYRYEKLDLPN